MLQRQSGGEKWKNPQIFEVFGVFDVFGAAMKLPTLVNAPKKSIVAILAGLVAVVLFATVTALVGGEALSGKIETGRYYVRSGAPYMEVSFEAYLLSAFSCLWGMLGLLIIANRVVYIMKLQGFFDERKALSVLLNFFFTFALGAGALFSMITIVKAFIAHQG